MRVLFEVSIKAEDENKTSFTWLSNERLFIIEDGRRMKTLSSHHDTPGKELHSATLAENRVCTSSCWNKDETLLALVVDKRQIYFWDIKTNDFSHFRPRSKNFSSKRVKNAQEIEMIKWSKVTNKFALIYSTGQILICNCDNNYLERFIDNCDGVLKKVTSFASCKQLDLFVCISEISEILVMTFDGEPRLYVQSDDYSVTRAKFSPLVDRLSNNFSTKASNPVEEDSIWLSLQTGSGRLLFKRILPQSHDASQIDAMDTDPIYNPSSATNSILVDFYWLSHNELLACFASGQVEYIKINKNLSVFSKSQAHYKREISSGIVLDMGQSSNTFERDSTQQSSQTFKSYILNTYHDLQLQSITVSLAAISNHQLYYYELCKNEHFSVGGFNYECEKVDELDLAVSLAKVKLELANIEWSPDCSMLAVQLSNNHLLVYRTRLQSMVCKSGRKSAFLSSPNEITVLDYGCRKLMDQNDETSSDDSSKISTASALTFIVKLKPSIIAVGPKHLAVALNNRVQFYLIQTELARETDRLSIEEEYASIIIAIQLCSRFVALHFDDGRLKLHAIQTVNLSSGVEYDSSDLADERFFPDPAKPERISAFCLCEKIFLYCTFEYDIHVFSLDRWTTLQNHNYSKQFDWPISKMSANDRGNKFICTAKINERVSDQDSVFLYDLYTNSVVSCSNQGLWTRIVSNQLNELLMYAEGNQSLNASSGIETKGAPLNNILDAIWDTDGRAVLLIERRNIHMIVVLDHTLDSEGPIIEYVDKTSKPSSYTVLYASHGIVSFQTELGRIINKVLESHDDDSRLTKLEQQIKQLDRESPSQLFLEIMWLKFAYLNSILPVYSLSRCKEICEHLMTSDEFKSDFSAVLRHAELSRFLWRLLAARALFTMNLNFALMVYRKYGPAIYARTLSHVVKDAHMSKGRGVKITIADKISSCLLSLK